MKHFINPNDVDSVEELVQLGLELKADPLKFQHLGRNLTMGLVFFNSSLRTRVSTQKAALNLGMNVIVMNVGSDSWQLEFEDGVIMDQGKAEHVKEAAAVLGQYCDVIGVRAFAGLTDRDEDYKEIVLESFRRYAGVPIVNLESATRHPCQSLADLITIEELKKKERPKVVLTWVPHFKPLPQAVANSFAEWVLKTDYEFVIANPEGYDLAPEIRKDALVMHDQAEAFKGADFIYAKNWSSYEHYGQVLTQDRSWAITEERMALTDDAFFMHCLPVRRGLKVADAVIDGPHSAVIQQAGNRVWSVQAAIKKILEARG
ncbi:ornithine carbamoyltransferase [Leadbetterella byssophila DSM 17132]|uniref:N-succinylornithine carbamoyltransferase n=1 Tax=Leadbetterella byssophila (strain DSM 17132 / JCM 16389 / KACC 11308 / NBRC 106382 / 4M15) TaxID=649349 RepID=E4RUF8_LEAB4|nr:N-acetylornithine carbamoyltransferase [Leadbetterella byssophila]ADQ17849.1 ornithine carbamoyltransferase [Leadbetterella byssophila DSM 17132]